MVKDFEEKKKEHKSNLFLPLDADKNSINYKTEYLIDGRKRIFYEPTIVGNIQMNGIFDLNKILF